MGDNGAAGRMTRANAVSMTQRHPYILCGMAPSPVRISAIDLFCGAGGLSLGLQEAGIRIAAGIDLDPACRFPYEANLGAPFVEQDVSKVQPDDLEKMWEKDSLRLLAGCAPCQPFSSHRRGADTRSEENWDLLSHFARLVVATRPDFVTMENVTRLGRKSVFTDFVATLKSEGYSVDFGVLYGPEFGLPQERRRLVLVASLRGHISLPVGDHDKSLYKTVRETISGLPALRDGEADPSDSLHHARKLSDINLARMKASLPGGTWRDWPLDLRAECHKKPSGASFQSFYGRMQWDQPSPTITTQSYNFGTGRFGHPEQHRSLTLREAAMLQGFPRAYRFTADGVRPSMQSVGRLIGNAVPPAFGNAVGRQFVRHVVQ